MLNDEVFLPSFEYIWTTKVGGRGEGWQKWEDSPELLKMLWGLSDTYCFASVPTTFGQDCMYFVDTNLESHVQFHLTDALAPISSWHGLPFCNFIA